MAQQMVNGSHYDGSTTITYRMSRRYAVVGVPGAGKHRKTGAEAEKRRQAWHRRQGAAWCEHNGYNKYQEVVRKRG